MTVEKKIRRREVFMQQIERMHFMPYKWGGDNPLAGFDCSGAAIEALRGVGIIKPKADMNANGIWKTWEHFEVAAPSRSCLAFWFKDDKAVHVAVCLDPYYCMTADGGGSETITVEDALEQDAYIKVRPIDHRTKKPRFIDLLDRFEE